MGRGRQKAKQTKVARKLKYYSPETDYAALERELSANRHKKEGNRPNIPPEWQDIEDKK